MDVFNVRDLKDRSSVLVREAERGHLSLVTKHGHPVFVALPFSEEMLTIGLHKTFALHLLKEQQATLRQAAKLAGLSMEGRMIALASLTGVPIVDYDPEELTQELQNEL